MLFSRHITKEFEIVNELGLHARPATMFVKTASKFESSVSVTNLENGKVADGKSILDMLMLASPKGSRISLDINGKDSAQAMNELQQLLEDGFGE